MENYEEYDFKKYRNLQLAKVFAILVLLGGLCLGVLGITSYASNLVLMAAPRLTVSPDGE